MPRQPRFILPGQPQHVIIRGNNRNPVFYADEDYRFYLDKLKQACDKHGCDVHAYVLMTNHVHLLVTPHKEDSLAKAMQMVGRYYVQYFNKTYQRTGTLWEGRYKATLIDSETYALTCYRYIEMNPVRAQGMAEHPAEYPWSSYRFNALGKADSLVVPHPMYERLGANPAQQQQAYRDLFNTLLDATTLDQIREATNKSWVLGSEYFKEKIAASINRPVSPATKGGDRKSKSYREIKNNRV
ncbi:MAG TPA: transposase [Candidatus Thiothrix moscowensis]|uniref:transposase n=1 Tax=unclassified Thiothrix TaxID=2636184 RepID=UPI002600C416|nr:MULTISPECIES: transposase [unclassified Thiothrix]HRJ53900.1 transposase [Candidatus Thiothrix moscowensis]HRJ93982.1 transposase [Candidatus Thiothrix moscowensis]